MPMKEARSRSATIAFAVFSCKSLYIVETEPYPFVALHALRSCIAIGLHDIHRLEMQSVTLCVLHQRHGE